MQFRHIQTKLVPDQPVLTVPGLCLHSNDVEFKSIHERVPSKIGYEYLMAPRELRPDDLDNPNVKHYFFTRTQIEKALPQIAKAFDRTFAIRNTLNLKLHGTGFICGDGLMLTCSHVAQSLIKEVNGFGLFGVDESIFFPSGEIIALAESELQFLVLHPAQPDLSPVYVAALCGKSFIPLADKLPSVGQRVYLIGNPQILGEQVISIGTVNEVCLQENDNTAFIETDNEAYHCCSGGPLLDDDGNCLGILSQSRGLDLSGFTIDSTFVPSVIAVDLIKDPGKYFDPDIELDQE